MSLTLWAGFRTHILIPGEVVGSIKENVPTWPGLERRWDATAGAYVFARNGRDILKVRRRSPVAGTVRVTATALAEVWLQEPGLSVLYSGGGTWRGYRRDPFVWTSDEKELVQKDAHISTVHFPRVRTNVNYTEGVRLLQGGTAIYLSSDGGFTALLDSSAGAVPWQGCQVFGRDYQLVGTTEGYEVLRRWELAGLAPDTGQMHFVGWTGGSGCVTDINGVDVGAPGNKYLWQPRSWRQLLAGQSISQTVTKAALP